MSKFVIEGRAIGPTERTLVIAEIGVNHDGSPDRAIELVHLAAAAGADAVKLQLFRADALMHPSGMFAAYQRDRVHDADPIKMLRRYELSEAAVEQVVASARELNLLPIATPFSLDDVDLIERLALPAIKVASPDLVNLPLLKRASRVGKPMLVSTGAATMQEVHRTVQWLTDWEIPFALLHCVSSYPVAAADANLNWISELASDFAVPIGFSDHTTEVACGALAVASGACVVEKHLTYDRTAQGPDHAASADPMEFKAYVKAIRVAKLLRGSLGKHVLAAEQDVRSVSRQSLVLRRAMNAGEIVRESDLSVQRPGSGIAAAEMHDVIGLRLKIPAAAGVMLKWEMLSVIAGVGAA